MVTWETWGEYFGYPECCIESFNTLEHMGQPPRKFHGTGYIPCPVCNQLPEEEIIAKIAERRKCDRPFPGPVMTYSDLEKEVELDLKMIKELGLI